MDDAGLGGLDDDLPPDTITLVASEEKPEKFELTLKAAKMSNLIKSIVDAGLLFVTSLTITYHYYYFFIIVIKKKEILFNLE